MNVIVSIEGREAIPVRALRFLALEGLSSDEVARALTDSADDFPTFSEVRAFHTQNGATEKLSPSYWESVDLELTRLSIGLPEESNAWAVESLKLLPAGVFVRRDEWESAYNNSLDGPNAMLKVAHCADDFADMKERILNFSPYVPPELAALVMEGFDGKRTQTQPQAAPEPAPVVEVPAKAPKAPATGPTYTMTKDAMIKQHRHEWPSIEQDIKDAKRNGLGVAKAGARGWDETIAMEWARVKGKRTGIDKPAQSLSGAMNSMASLPTSRKYTLER